MNKKIISGAIVWQKSLIVKKCSYNESERLVVSQFSVDFCFFTEISLLYKVSDQSSILFECVPAYYIFEQELTSRVELPLDDNACQHELSGNVRSLFDTPADVNSYANSGFSPSQSIKMSANDTDSLNQSDNRTCLRTLPIQSISHCIL